MNQRPKTFHPFSKTRNSNRDLLARYLSIFFRWVFIAIKPHHKSVLFFQKCIYRVIINDILQGGIALTFTAVNYIQKHFFCTLSTKINIICLIKISQNLFFKIINYSSCVSFFGLIFHFYQKQFMYIIENGWIELE